MFLLSNGATVFTAEVHAIKEAITDDLKKGFSDFDVYSDSRSALKALKSLGLGIGLFLRSKTWSTKSMLRPMRTGLEFMLFIQETKEQMSWQRLPLNAFGLMW